MSDSVYQIITNKIIEKMESTGTIPWHTPWRTEAPCNLMSLREYNGLNRILLASDGYSSKFWLTLNQANKLGGRIKKGEHSSIVTFWKRNTYTKKNEAGDDETRQGFLLRYFRLFNLCQTEGIAENLGLGESPKPVPNIGVCDAIVKGMPARPTIVGSDHAWYSPISDQVGIPARENFTGSEEYYSTLFHELVHSTGHKSRLHREQFDNPVKFGSESYSKEELVAELGASMLCGVAGISPRTLDNSAAYLKGWVSRLRGDSRLIVSAASQAQKASDFILDKSAKSVETESEVA